MIGVFSRGILRIPHLETFLGAPIQRLSSRTSSAVVSRVAGWGLKPTADSAITYAKSAGLSYVSLEDGFLRSVALGKDDPPLSLVVDDLGVYYDATRPSRLEALIAAAHTPVFQSRASRLIETWRAARVSKYNHAREMLAPRHPYVLVADQTLGDASLQYGLAEVSSFERMIEAALDENPDCTILLKVHPEVMAGRKQGHFDLDGVLRNPRVQVLGQDVHPVSLIEHSQAVYVVTSQMGFEGLLWGKRVRTFGMPFYAGWGLTQDELPAPHRRHTVPLENLVHAALVEYPRYIDPETGNRCEVERVLEWMALQRRLRERFPAEIYALRFSRWKKPIVRDFFQGSTVKFVRRAEKVPAGATLAVWGRKDVSVDGIHSNTSSSPVGNKVRLVRLEDGFLRSVGLGADLVRPLSWVVDRCGIYYDATQPSGLEHILENAQFDEALRARARALRERLVAEGLTKYNVGAVRWQRPLCAPLHSQLAAGSEIMLGGRRVILVPGQVESDASLGYGAPGICGNLDLLRVVREANPGAYVIYKPHPDVVAGLRRKGQGESEATRWCDELVSDVSMGELLPQVDEVHTLTSLTGFEALLRDKRVVCYGQPFYAGWGVTEDVLPAARRTRRLSLDALVAGVLILYPTYVSRTTGKFTTPERAMDELLAWRATGASTLPWWRKGLRRVLALAQS
jgi:capsular polysaccharide export protein